METREWALVFFTIAAQMSVWSFVVWASCTSSLTRKAARRGGPPKRPRTTRIGPVLVLGLLASLLHLEPR